MDKNKLAEDYQKKVSHNCQADNCRSCYDITTAYLAGFDAATEQANHINLTLHEKITELEQQLAERDAEIEKNGKFQDFLADEVKRLQTANALLEQQLKKAESVMNQIKIEFNSGRNPHEIWTLDLIEQYLKSRGE